MEKVEKLETKKDSLVEALNELTSQLKQLSEEKLRYEQILDNTISSLNTTKTEEDSLKNKISFLREKESKLVVKKERIYSRIEQLNEKIVKVARIQDELKELESIDISKKNVEPKKTNQQPKNIFKKFFNKIK